MWKDRLAEYGYNVLVGLDQFVNTLLSGYPDETLSARTWRKAQAGQWFWRCLRVVIDLLARPFEADHCRISYENEAARGHSPAELEVKNG